MSATPDQIAQSAWSWAVWIVVNVTYAAIGLLVMATALQTFGFRIPMLPAMDPTKLVYLAGCFYLWRKA